MKDIPLTRDGIRCNLCSHRCKIKMGKRGFCGAGENCDGKLFSLSYGRIAAIADTYTETKISCEFAYDTVLLANKKVIRTHSQEMDI